MIYKSNHITFDKVVSKTESSWELLNSWTLNGYLTSMKAKNSEGVKAKVSSVQILGCVTWYATERREVRSISPTPLCLN